MLLVALVKFAHKNFKFLLESFHKRQYWVVRGNGRKLESAAAPAVELKVGHVRVL